MSALKSVVAAALGAALSFAASGAPIAYTFKGTASGSLNGASFANQPLTVVIQGDTANVNAVPGGAGLYDIFSGLSSAVTLGSLLAGSFAGSDLYLVNSQSASDGTVTFGTGMDLIGLTANALRTYDLKTALGPVGGVVDAVALGQFSSIGLAGGSTLTVSSLTNATFAAAPVPEPSSLVLAGLGLAVVAGAAARRGAAPGSKR